MLRSALFRRSRVEPPLPASWAGFLRVAGGGAILAGMFFLLLRSPAVRAHTLGSAAGAALVSGGLALALVAQARRREAARWRRRQADLHQRTRRLRLQPHFLFNALQTVQSLVQEGRTGDAQRAMAALGDLLAQCLEREERSVIRLEDELRFARSWLELQQLRFGGRLSVQWEVEGACRSEPVPPLFLQPLVENAIRHGGVGSDGRRSVALRARRANGWLEIDISNPADGAARVRSASGSGRVAGRGFGVGLATARKILWSAYGDDARIELRRRPTAVRTLVRFPLRLEPCPNREVRS